MAKAKAALIPYAPHVIEPHEWSSNRITVYRPLVTVELTGPIGALTQTGLLDTGADETILPIELLEVIGHEGPRGVVVQAHVVGGGKIDALYSRVRFTFSEGGITPFHWETMVAFAQSIAEPIFGHRGFLEHFTARFNGPGRYVTLTPHRPPTLVRMRVTKKKK